MPKNYLKITPIFVVLLLLGCTSNSDVNEIPEATGSSFQTATQEDHINWIAVEPEGTGTGFQRLLPEETGVDYATYVTPEEISQNRFLLDGTGVATADVDGDGLSDIYFTQLNGPNKLYKNMGGFRFEDITEQAGVGHKGNYSTGTLFADVNGDGSPDLLVATVNGENAVYINDGRGQFSLKEDSGLKPGNGSTTMTMADIDQDGDLDLFIAYYREKRVYDIFDEKELLPRNILRRVSSGGMQFEFKEPFDQYYDIIYRKNLNPTVVEIGEKNMLYINDGTGRFTDVTDQESRFFNAQGESIKIKPDWSLTAKFHDINGDMLPDLIVCNDYYSPDRVWVNQGNGSFKEMDTFSVRSYSFSSMGVDVADINRDGHSDFFITDMLSPRYKLQASHGVSKDKRPAMIKDANYRPQYMHNTMFLNRGDNTFQEIAYYSGVEASGWSWATRFLDVNLDGYEDLLINTGYPYDAMDMDFLRNKGQYESISLEKKAAPKLDLRNFIFRNNGDLTFSDRSEEWGFTEVDVSFGLATADFDNDGDLDVVTSRFRSKAGIFKNNSTAPRIGVRLSGQSPNTLGVGAKVTLEGGPVIQSKYITAGSDYMSGSDNQVMFAANTDNANHTIKVEWPNGNTTVVDNVSANRIYDIAESADQTSFGAKQEKQIPKPVFEDLSEKIGHTHKSDIYDDFKRQPLLPIKLSAEGPGLAWLDYDQDGDDDLFIGGNSTQKMSVYENRGNFEFNEIRLAGRGTLGSGTATSFLGWHASNEFNMIIGNSDYQLPTGQRAVPDAFHFTIGKDGAGNLQHIKGMYESTGSIAAADYDNDGDVDLFIAGRVIPSLYPLSVNSRLFKNNGSKFVEDGSNNEVFDKVGLTTGVIFTDYDRDGDPDLVASTEWGQIKVFENHNGNFREKTSELGLSNHKGHWSSIASGDFNNDGLMDIVATNIGKNTPYKLRSGSPLKLYYDDFNNDGNMEMIEARHDDEMGEYVPIRKLYEFSEFESIVSGTIKSYEHYAGQTLQELIGSPLNQIPSKEINTLSHTVFMNTGSGFKAYPLPVATQFTTANGAMVADYNNDGNEDIFITQNFFNVTDDYPRQDAGRSMLLHGDGTGQFTPVSSDESGLTIYGQQRGAAFSDINKDGRVDLAVTQRDSTTKLYMNSVEKQGIRVELKGPDQNQAGIGTALRVVYDDGSKGPLREIQAGTGHYSMNSLVAVLGINPSKEAIQLEVHWHDGEQTSLTIEPNKWNYLVSHPSS